MISFFVSRSVNTVEFMNMVNTHTQVLENGLRELRYELMADPLRSTGVDINTEVIILSGLREKCSNSMSHIEKLYEETKFLKTFIENLESKAHYDLEVLNQGSKGPSFWIKRIIFLSIIFGTCGYYYRTKFPEDFQTKFNQICEIFQYIVQCISVNGKSKQTVQTVTLTD